jgi:hypothetical protein
MTKGARGGGKPTSEGWSTMGANGGGESISGW